MPLNFASLNTRRLRDPSNCTHFLGELLDLSVVITAVQETHFLCTADARVLEGDCVVVSAFGGRCSAGVSMLIGRSFNADVDLAFAGDGGRLVMAVKSIVFQVVAVYEPNSAGERRSFFRLLEPFLDDLKRLVLVGDWNAVLDPKIRPGGSLVGCTGVKAAWSTS